MARSISADALDIIGTGAAYRTALTVTLPGDEPVTIENQPGWSVTENAVLSGTRLSISGLTLLPTDGVDDLFAFAGAPGAAFDAKIGVVKGAETEWLQSFHGRAVEGSSRRNSLGVSVALTDDWQWFDGVPFTTPLETGIVTRASQIEEIVLDVMPSLTVVATADGSTLCSTGVYTNSRGQAVAQLADDGLLVVGFNSTGDLIIKARRDLDTALTPDWYFRTDQDTALIAPVPPANAATIVAGTLERTRPFFEALVNSVKVVPGGDWQTWTAQTANLTDSTDDRHESHVGLRQVEITSNTIGNAYDAWLLAKAELTRRLRITEEKVKLSVAMNPAVEADDVCFISALPTLDDSGWNGTYIITSVTHAPSEGTTSLEAVSASGYELGT